MDLPIASWCTRLKAFGLVEPGVLPCLSLNSSFDEDSLLVFLWTQVIMQMLQFTFVLCRKLKTLGESDDENDSAAAWVVKSRQLEEDQRLAEQRVCILRS